MCLAGEVSELAACILSLEIRPGQSKIVLACKRAGRWSLIANGAINNNIRVINTSNIQSTRDARASRKQSLITAIYGLMHHPAQFSRAKPRARTLHTKRILPGTASLD